VSQGSRAALILAAIAVLVGGFILANGSGDDDKDASTTPATTATTPNDFPPPPGTTRTASPEPAAPPIPTVRVVGGKPQGGVAKLDFKKGDTIRFRVVSDVSDEIHVHGYDLMKDVKAGGSVAFSFKGDIDGKFEIELEGAKQQIASLTVEP
jgi:hypothetical protein